MTTPTPPAPAESPQPAKAKEEPKAVAKSEAVVDSKPAAASSPAGDDAASQPKRLEKRNSIQLFFKNLVRGASLFSQILLKQQLRSSDMFKLCATYFCLIQFSLFI